MNLNNRMNILSDTAQYDLCDYVSSQKQSIPNLPGIYYTSGQNGCQVPVFKVLMTNKCSNDCKYCVNCSKRSFTRAELSSDELCRVFLDYYSKHYVEGLFLTSGIKSSVDESMETIVETIRKLRMEYGYSDYIHLKILPGASKDLIKRSMELASRVSINIESATPDGLSELCSTKDFNKDIIRRFKWINQLSNRDKTLLPSGYTTQFIVGATDETDKEILDRVKWLYDKFGLSKSYFSKFTAVEETPLANKKEPNPFRTNRLYQTDSLLYSYNYNVDELCFDDNGLLDVDIDPKISAAENMDIFPVEINDAPYSELIRVPGIGVKSARKIISMRKKRPFSKLSELKELGVAIGRAEKYIKLSGNYQTALDLF